MKLLCIMVSIYLTVILQLNVKCQINDDLFKINNGVFSDSCHYQYYEIEAGGRLEIANIRGPGKITYFYLTDFNKVQDSTIAELNYYISAKNTNCFYSGLVLQIYWDNNPNPSVNVPLADFFGAMKNNPVDFDSRLFSVNHYCYMCYIPMPFSTNARFVILNDGNKKYGGLIAYDIDFEINEQYANEKSRFHAFWTRSNPVKEGIHQLINIKGKGHYVGNFLYVKSNWKGWWGEGDTNFEIDGTRMTHSFGTEDEYGSCWEFENKTYFRMNFGHILDEKGKYLQYRWYTANPVRFRQSLTVDIQNQRWEEPQGQTSSRDEYISVVYYYLEGSHKVELQPYRERTARSNAVKYEKFSNPYYDVSDN